MNMGFFGNLMKSLGSALTGDPFGALGSITSMATSIGGTRRAKKLMQEQDRINDENYERERQDKLEDYQRTLNDQKLMVEDERQYNSIGAVMQRARDANVSPLAALGVSSGNTLASVSPPQGTSSQGVSQPADTSASRGQAVMAAVSTLQDMKIQRERLKIDKDLAKQEIRESETRSILNEMQARRYDEETTARINKLLAEGNTEEARKVMIEADTKLKEQEHQQKEEMFPLEKRESESRTQLNNAHANKTSFEDWYQRTHHRSMSNGMAHLIDTISDSLWSGQPGADARIDGRDATTRIGEIFDKLKSVAGYFSDESLFEYAKLLYGWFKDKGISFGPTKR